MLLVHSASKNFNFNIISATRRRRHLVPHDSSELLNELRREEKEKNKEKRRLNIIQRKQEQESQYQRLLAWDSELLGRQGLLYKHMWEVSKIDKIDMNE